jgi:type IV pilus assembly protein PilV
MLAYDMLDRIRANEALSSRVASKEPLIAFNMAETATAAAASTPASAVDRYQWMTAVNAALPGAKARITCDGTTLVCNIQISWKELNSSGNESEDSTTFVFEARI